MTGVSPEKILRELAALWDSLGKQENGERGAGVLRACTMTLVVLAEESEDAAALGETIAALMPEHPARTITVRLHGAAERVLGERVYSQCWMPFGQRRQICCEQIEITASDAALPDLPGVVLPLAAPDLPVILWCRSARLWDMPEFRQIAALAHKVVVDSGILPDARRALRQIAEAAERGETMGDLAWTRLTRWREMLAQVFENRQYLSELASVSSVRVGFGGAYETSAWYMGAWVMNALASAGVRAACTVAPESGENLMRVEMQGAGLHVTLGRRDERLVATVNGLSTCTNLPLPSDYLLMREELGIVRHDAVFEQALASAARLAYA